jgi:hypothetical protein
VGIPVVGSNGMVGSAVTRRSLVRKILLLCGILASLLYVGTDILGAVYWEGYSYTSQTISELSAIGAPSRPLVVPLFLTQSVLIIAFGLGVWRSAGRNRALRVVGGLLVGFGVFCLTGPFAPMHLRGTEKTLTDTLHVIGAGVDVLFILLIMGFGANAFGKGFRLFSIGAVLALLVFGALAGLDGPRVAANLPTPWAGANERVCNYSYWLWQLVLAIVLLRAEMRPGAMNDSDRTVPIQPMPGETQG